MTSPVAQLQYLALAEEFYQAFGDLPENGPSGIPVNWPRYFALCHSTELALKAFLLAHGWSEQQIRGRQFRHNISELMRAAMALGLNISQQSCSEIDLLSEAHEKYWPRYPDQTGRVFLIDQLEEPFVELLSAVADAVRGGGRLYVEY